MNKNEDALKNAIANIQKKYGKEAVVTVDVIDDFKVDVIPTGCPQIDEALGCGGLPRGRIIEVFGENSSGKSTLAMFFMAQVQKSGGKAALVDAEFSFNSEYARNIGLNVEELIVSQPDTLEEAADVVKELVASSAVDIIVVDSVASLVPKKELESDEMLKDTVAEQARLMNKALRILTGAIARSKAVVIFINQTREKIGVFYGKKESTPGGKALKFYSSVRIEVRSGEKIEGNNGEQIGNWIKATMVKNKVGFPWKSAEFALYYKKGVDLSGADFENKIKLGEIEKKGNTYFFKGEKLGVGKDAARESYSKLK